MTTTVRRSLLKTLPETITQGRVLGISDPKVGSRRTHQTSPRRGSTIVPARGRLHPSEHRTSSRCREHPTNCLQPRKPEPVVLHAPGAYPLLRWPHTET